MKKTLLMAVDLGTSFIKTGVYDSASNCVAEAMEPAQDYRPGPGVFIQKGEELFDSVVKCMKSTVEQLGDKAKDVEAISFTGQMSGFMGVDRHWNDITTWSCSLDTRYMPYADRQMAQLKDKFLGIGGTNFPQMAPKYQWFQAEYPEESKKIAKYLMISGYVIGRLGKIDIEDAVIDRTFTQWTGLADVQNDRWSEEICEAIGLDTKYLPRIVNSNTTCGKLSAEAAKMTGLSAGITLVSGAGDKAAGCLGSGGVNLGDMIFEASSYGEVSCCVPEYRPDFKERRLDVIPSAIPGEFYATHFIAGSGITLDWFINTFVRREGESLRSIFDDLGAKAAKIPPGCDGLMAIGLLGGSSMPSDGVLRGMWMGHDWSHRIEHFYRALLESFSYDFALCIRSIEELYPEYDRSPVRIIGGGAKDSVWTQMNADITGRTYFTINRNDTAMWGASILAGNAIGMFPDMKKTALDNIKKVQEYRPDNGQREKYGKFIDLYAAYTVELRDFYKRIQDLQGRDAD